MRIAAAVTVAVVVTGWAVAAWLLTRTSVPSLHLSGFDERRFFSAASLARARSYSRGEDRLWVAATVAELAALAVLARRLPRGIRSLRFGRVRRALIAGIVILVTLWVTSLPFAIADLWWQHHFGLGPFAVGGWLVSQWSVVVPELLAALLAIALVVGLAGRYRFWWLPAGAAIVAGAALFALVDGWTTGASAHRLRSPELRADVRRLERAERVGGTPVGVQDVSSWTTQANAFSVGFGPSAHVVLWSTILERPFTRGEDDVVLAHELGHVRSRHVVKAIGWSALAVLPALWLLALATRGRGGLGDPANLAPALLVLALLGLVTLPAQNWVSRRYEAEADWRALNATHDPASARKLFEDFGRTDLEQPSPPLWDYVLLEDHPTLMQRIAMTERWR